MFALGLMLTETLPVDCGGMLPLYGLTEIHAVFEINAHPNWTDPELNKVYCMVINIRNFLYLHTNPIRNPLSVKN